MTSPPGDPAITLVAAWSEARSREIGPQFDTEIGGQAEPNVEIGS